MTLEDGAVDREDPMAELLHTLRLALGRFEARQTAARTRFALRRKRDRGERAGTVAFGYRLVGDGSDRVEEDPKEQRVLRLLGELRAAGYSLREIAAELNRQGFTTRRGTAWKFEYVRNLADRLPAVGAA
jgi:DNA invertase Pin-like site-specific DNA recombinase